MWIYVATSFSRYRKVGAAARREFESAMQKDGFVHLHPNLFVRYCTTGSNAAMHKARVKQAIPHSHCDVSIMMIPDSQEQNIYHSLNRRRRRQPACEKPSPVEFL